VSLPALRCIALEYARRIDACKITLALASGEGESLLDYVIPALRAVWGDTVNLTGLDSRLRVTKGNPRRKACMTNTRIPSTAFADAWINVDSTEDPGFFVQLLDSTRNELLERARRSPAEFFTPLEIRAGHRVLDVGCGTGDFLRLLAPLVAPGSAVGIDLSETMIAEAQRRTSSGSSNVSFQVGNALDLPFESRSIDRLTATQVLLHIPDTAAALAEMWRVLAPGGLVAFGEIDWGTVTVECTDRELGRRFTRLACDELRNGLIVRELPCLLRNVGFDRILMVPEVQLSLNPDAFYRWFIEPSMPHFKRIGGFSPAEVEFFLADMQERASQGRYFCSRTYYSIRGSRST
jgi:ubiquinone/menaquinone biosynthesis C-methylase UbiE